MAGALKGFISSDSSTRLRRFESNLQHIFDKYENIDDDGDETEVNLCDLSVHRGRKQLVQRKTKGFGHSKLRSTPREGDIGSKDHGWSRPREGDIGSKDHGWSRPREGDIESTGHGWSRRREGDIESTGHGWSRPREGDIESTGHGWSRRREGDIESTGHGWSRPREGDIESTGHGWSRPREGDIESTGHGWSRPREGDIESTGHGWSRPREGDIASRGHCWNPPRQGDIESKSHGSRPREGNVESKGHSWRRQRKGCIESRDHGQKNVNHNSLQQIQQRDSCQHQRADLRAPDQYGSDSWHSHQYPESHSSNDEPDGMGSRYITGEDRREMDPYPDDISRIQCLNETYKDVLSLFGPDLEEDISDAETLMTTSESEESSDEDLGGVSGSLSSSEESEEEDWMYKSKEKKSSHRRVKESPRLESYFASSEDSSGYHSTDFPSFVKDKNRIHKQYRSQDPRVNIRQVKSHLTSGDSELVRVKRPDYRNQIRDLHPTDGNRSTEQAKRQLSRSRSLNLEEYESFGDLPVSTNTFSEYPNIQGLREANPELYKQPMSSFEKVTKWIMPQKCVNGTETDSFSCNGYGGQNETGQKLTYLPSPGTSPSRYPPKSPRRCTVFSSPKSQSFPSSPQTVRVNISNSPSSSLARLHLLSPKSSPKPVGNFHKKLGFENDSFCQSVPPMFKVPDAFPYQKSPSTRDRVWKSGNVGENKRGGRGHQRSSSFDGLSRDRICSLSEYAPYTRKIDDMPRTESEVVGSVRPFPGCREDGVDELSVNRQGRRSNGCRCCHENQHPRSCQLQSVKKWKPKFIGSLFPVDRQNLNESRNGTYFHKPCMEKKEDTFKAVNVDRINHWKQSTPGRSNTRQRNSCVVSVLQSTPRKSNHKLVLDSSLSTINPNMDRSSDEEEILLI